MSLRRRRCVMTEYIVAAATPTSAKPMSTDAYLNTRSDKNLVWEMFGEPKNFVKNMA